MENTTTPAAPTTGLPAWSALARALGKMPSLEKSAKNKDNGSHYIPAGDLLAAARRALAGEGLAPDFRPGKPETTERKGRSGTNAVIRVAVACALVHGESGSRCAEGEWIGEAYDFGPLSISSAISMAKRLYLVTQLLVDGADQEDADQHDVAAQDKHQLRAPARPARPEDSIKRRIWAHKDVIGDARLHEIQTAAPPAGCGLPDKMVKELTDEQRGTLLDKLDALAAAAAGEAGGAA